MSDVSVLILRAPGTNCELETAHAWEQVGARTRSVHINVLLGQPSLLSEVQILTIPGGFSYGDDVSAGKIMASAIDTFLSGALVDFVAAGKLILGICNGFQVLVKTGLLPGGTFGKASVTLAFNTSGRYETRWVHLKPVSGRCRFVDGEGLLFLPVAHAEGRVVACDEQIVERLNQRGHVAFRYTDEQGRPGPYPVNPNGSVDSIAGLTDQTGQVLGLMPHPERHVHFTHHPFWTKSPKDRAPDGLRLFQAAVASLG
ncbi:MAG: phosphoribosylformylglycinamidine synthase I [Phycisphaerae bacterium]